MYEAVLNKLKQVCVFIYHQFTDKPKGADDDDSGDDE